MHEPNVLKKNETPHDYRIKIEDEELNLIKKSGIKKILETIKIPTAASCGVFLSLKVGYQSRCKQRGINPL